MILKENVIETAMSRTAHTSTAAKPSEQYRFDVVLRNGSIVHLRPVRHDDERRLREFGDRQSGGPPQPASFQLPKMDTERIHELAHAADDSTFTLISELHDRIVAVARYVRDEHQPDVAHSAFIVDDALQGRGLGSALLDRLADIARERGIRWLDGDVYAANHRMQNMIAASGFEVVQRKDGGLLHVRLDLQPTPHYEQRLHERQAQSTIAGVKIFLEPKSVAVVGASRDPAKIGSVVLHNLIKIGYTGRIFPINPKTSEIESLPTFPRVADVPEPIDLAVIAVPLEYVDAVVDDCIAHGVRGILLLTAGYSETGAEGRDRERALFAKLRSAGMRLIGPNCFGVINTDPAVRLNTSFSPIQPMEGSVGLLTQSGALGQAILDYARDLNLGLSNFISVGNKADISGNDLLQFWSQDDRTNVILLYLESFGNPRKFSRIAREVARKKPIICVKSGRSGAGARAASSHTGSLAGSDKAADAMFRQCGVIRTNTLEELFDMATLLSHQPLPRGNRVAILTNAGGPGIMAADACEANGLELPTLDDATMKTLRSFLPAAASVANPVDMIASADAPQYGKAMRALLDDPNVDSVLVLFVPLHPGSPKQVAEAIRAAVPEECEKPVLATFLSAQGMPAELAGIPSYRFPEGAANALGRALRYARWRERPAGKVAAFNDFNRDAARSIVESALERGGGWLPAQEAGALLEAARIPVARADVAVSLDEALDAAHSIGYPVALKAIGPEIIHKTEVGGVQLNIKDDAALERVYADLASRLGEKMTAVLIQQMIPRGVETLIGATLDETFGHVIAYGTGGTMVELMQDVALRLQPLTERDVDEMFAEVRGTALLRGWRGSPSADESAVRDILLRLSALLELCPEIEEVDFNPTLVQQHGAVVVDARIRVGSTSRRTGLRPVV
jgi:acetate---CoA ligase (ADP-forming)